MEFFSNEIAFTLQYFTFPLEVIGFTLALIEVRFSTFAAFLHYKMESILKRQEIEKERGIFKSILNLKDEGMIKAYGEEGAKTRYQILSATAILLFLGLIINEAWRYLRLDFATNGTDLMFFLTLIPVIALFSIGMFYLTRFVVRWVPDRSVGNLGIIIAGFGILGEAYQFTTQLVV